MKGSLALLKCQKQAEVTQIKDDDARDSRKVTDQSWVSKYKDQAATQILAISYTFLQPLGVEVVLVKALLPPCALLSTDTWRVKVHKSQVSPKTVFADRWDTGFCVARQQTWELQLGETRCTWQSSAERMVQAKGMPERPLLFPEHKEMATMKWSFRMKPKHHEVQTLGFAQRMQSLTKSDLLHALPLQREKKGGGRGRDGKEHYFYIRGIKFLYMQDT